MGQRYKFSSRRRSIYTREREQFAIHPNQPTVENKTKMQYNRASESELDSVARIFVVLKTSMANGETILITDARTIVVGMHRFPASRDRFGERGEV